MGRIDKPHAGGSNSTGNLSNVAARRANTADSSLTSTSTQSSPLPKPVTPQPIAAVGSESDTPPIFPEEILNEAPEDEGIFQDALETIEDAEPRSSDATSSTGEWQPPIDLVESGGVQCVYETMPSFTTAVINLGFSREPSESVESPTTRERSSTPPLAAQGQTERSPLVASVPVPRSPQKKALLIGINYEQHGEENHLRHATGDARRFAAALTKLGYSSENMRVATDVQGQPFPSCEYLLECMDWLVQDASEGDRLFFTFSGNCLLPSDCAEPYLVTADMMPIPRSTFQERLVSRVPTGAELNIVLDCCHAAGMVQLKYCIGRMAPEIKQTDGSAVSESKQPTAPAIHSVPQHGSLCGLKPVDLQPLVHGPLVPEFQERGDGFVSPAGRVIFWASTGEHQKVFEASDGVENGVVTNVICSVLDKCVDSPVTHRDLWKSIVDAIDEENRCRRDHDGKLDFPDIPDNTRLQLAELWASQEGPLSSPLLIFDQVVESPCKPSEVTI